MKFLPILLFCGLAAVAGDLKQLPGQAGNDDLDLNATVFTTPAEMRQALGGPDMQPGYLIVRVKVTPKSSAPLRLGPDDFTLISHKDGQRSSAQTAHQVAGGGAVLVLRPAAEQPHGDGTTVSGPVWGGVSVKKRPAPNSEGGAPQVKNSGTEDGPLVQLLTEKALPDKEYKEPGEGLLYFGLDGKLKPKDLSLIYQGAAGKLVIDFK